MTSVRGWNASAPTRFTQRAGPIFTGAIRLNKAVAMLKAAT